MARKRADRWITGAALTAPLTMALVVAGADPASAAVTATFIPNSGVVTVFGDSLDNTVVVSRRAAGALFVNGGAVPISGGAPSVANVTLIQVFGLGGADRLTLDQANGALPPTCSVARATTP